VITSRIWRPAHGGHSPAILKRLVAVFEMRDTGKAAAFLRAYQKAVPDDPWGTSKAEHFSALGLV
jgi:hypothetical protein